MISGSSSSLENRRKEIRDHLLVDRTRDIPVLLDILSFSEDKRSDISKKSAALVTEVRQSSRPKMMDQFMSEYGLSTQEGIALMCLAEALLRVPDGRTMDELIRDKITRYDWASHSHNSSPVFINASAWALMLTGRVLDNSQPGIEGTIRGLVRRLGEPTIRAAVTRAMRSMGEQFVLGQTIESALSKAEPMQEKGYLYSFDMLGEAARTEEDATRYFDSYMNAIKKIGAKDPKNTDIKLSNGISVKLSALHPRYESTHKDKMLPVISDRLAELAIEAKKVNIGMNIDAEESERLDISLDIVENILSDDRLKGWDGFGLVIQTYAPRAPYVIDWVYDLASQNDRKITLRLVKGAYWDTEIKRSQIFGISGFPVFTDKAVTDVSYLACARKLLGMTDRIYPQFATHNAHTITAILSMSNDRKSFEFQRLHGMGDAIHSVTKDRSDTQCRIYAPVGAHSDLLAYLVRRLLENGANSSFVNQILDKNISPDEIVADPIEHVLQLTADHNPLIDHPHDLFMPERKNSKGYDIFDPSTIELIDKERSPYWAPYQWNYGTSNEVTNPADLNDTVGSFNNTDISELENVFSIAKDAQKEWCQRTDRSDLLRKCADTLEENTFELFALLAREAGKTLADAIAEVREAVDFLRYYAAQVKYLPHDVKPQGTIVCISPWNFPLAIFVGQISAALVTGNSVIAKPAEQTPLIAARAVELFNKVGIPKDVLQLVFGDGELGAALTANSHLNGVCFTGSSQVAKLIEKQMSKTAPLDAMLIAETGGLNAMIVGSTALTEQVTRDVIASAFQSAGQRCSALRILYIQEDVKKRTLDMISGALDTMKIGNPANLDTDIGPVIDQEAKDNIITYCKQNSSSVIKRIPAPSEGYFVEPQIIEVAGIQSMEREIFGPILHVATFKAKDLEEIISDINNSNYGLTLGMHTRIDARVQQISDLAEVGNVYVNRNQIGAIVGSQPFGGEKMSGTGPKAGGPHYLRRFVKDSFKPAEEVSTHVTLTNKDMPDGEKWSKQDNRITVLRDILRGKASHALSSAAALDCGPIDLPGPTGEVNNLRLLPRGRVLCVGPKEIILDQVVQALAMGNSVVAVCPQAKKYLQPLLDYGLPLVVYNGFPEIGKVEFGAIAGTNETLRRQLANRDGHIIPVITDHIAPNAYCIERCLSVDTTAAGGNASLLASVGAED